MNTESKLVIFDLDGVLTLKDTFFALLCAQARLRPRSAILAIPSLVRWLLSVRDLSRNAREARRITSQILSGISRPEYEEMAARLGTAWGRDGGWTRTAALEELANIRMQGYRIVIATASERVLAAAYLASAGAQYDELVASEIEFHATDHPRFVTHLRGQAKLDGLRERGINPGHARFYTDSSDDMATAAASREVILVAPSNATVSAYRNRGIAFSILSPAESRG